MQASLLLTPPVLPLQSTKNLSQAVPVNSPLKLASRSSSAIKASTLANDTSTVDYSSLISVFPAEACETLGGEACSADIFPEAKLSPVAAPTNAAAPTESADREYLDYDNIPKTVFCAEACDDLGGEFCGREYQRGVY